MRYVCLFILIHACVGSAQDGGMTAQEVQAAVEADMRERAVLGGAMGALPLAPGRAGSPLDKNNAILSALDLPLSPAASRPQSAGIISVQKLAHKIPKQAAKAFERAAKLSKDRKHTEAVQELKQAITVDPDFAEAHTNLGVQYYLLNRPAEAETALLRALELDPASASAYVDLAAVKLLQRDADAAEGFARRALALSPRSERAQRILDTLHPKAQ
jgi:Flp pilus assembly protein TadD